MRIFALIALLLWSGCARRAVDLDAPSEAARHRAALASITVVNQTAMPLAIAFRTATPPVQEVVIGRAVAGARSRMAPVPAGEPIILIARRNDGAEYQTHARSFALDADFVWDIPKSATFSKPEPRK